MKEKSYGKNKYAARVIVDCKICATLSKKKTGWRICVRTGIIELQRLKPNSFCSTYVVAKATTHNDFSVLTQTLKPVLLNP
jgi:hypothetical protein